MRRKKGRPPPVRGWKSPRGIVCPCESPRRLLHVTERHMDFNWCLILTACEGEKVEIYFSEMLYFIEIFQKIQHLKLNIILKYYIFLFYFKLFNNLMRQVDAPARHHLTPTKAQYIIPIENLCISKIFDTI